jgi:hypothetical protein
VNQSTVIVPEGTTATASGAFTDALNLSLTFSASRDSVVSTGSGRWTWSELVPDGPLSDTVTITATASDGRISKVTFTLVVLNVAPKIGSLKVDLSNCVSGRRNGSPFVLRLGSGRPVGSHPGAKLTGATGPSYRILEIPSRPRTITTLDPT